MKPEKPHGFCQALRHGRARGRLKRGAAHAPAAGRDTRHLLLQRPKRGGPTHLPPVLFLTVSTACVRRNSSCCEVRMAGCSACCCCCCGRLLLLAPRRAPATGATGGEQVSPGLACQSMREAPRRRCRLSPPVAAAAAAASPTCTPQPLLRHRLLQEIVLVLPRRPATPQARAPESAEGGGGGSGLRRSSRWCASALMDARSLLSSNWTAARPLLSCCSAWSSPAHAFHAP